MLKLLKKEWTLVLIKPSLLFFLLATTMLIPSYPAIVPAFFVFFVIQISFTTAQSNRDIEFTAMLPVSRKQIVASKILFTNLVQIAYLLFCVPFAIISSIILNPEGNIVGMDKNIAFFGYALIATAVFNILFFPIHFKNTHKIGLPIMSGLFGFFLFTVIFEITIALAPSIKNVLDTLNPAMVVPQIIFTICCLILYIAMMFVTYKLSSKAFKKMAI